MKSPDVVVLGARVVDRLDPLVEMRSRHWSLAVPRDRDAFVSRFCALPQADPVALRDFFGNYAPRTFERFTGRHLGYVGGVPRRIGLQHYRLRLSA